MTGRGRWVLLLLGLAIWSLVGVAQEAEKKPCETTAETAKVSKTRCEVLATCVVKTLYLSNLSQPTEMQDVVNAIRSIGEVQRVQQILGEQTLVVEGTPEQVEFAEKLAAEMDKAKWRFGNLGYRIDLKIQESQGEKKLRSRVYSVVTQPRQDATVSLRGEVVAAQSESGGDSKTATDSGNARNIECRIVNEHERTLDLRVEATFSGAGMNEANGGPSVRTKLSVTVELDKPTVITRVDDPDSGRSFTIEVTATRVKG